jgi:hypothetical protein
LCRIKVRPCLAKPSALVAKVPLWLCDEDALGFLDGDQLEPFDVLDIATK